MFQPDLIGRLQGDFYNVCSCCFNLTIRYIYIYLYIYLFTCIHNNIPH